MFHPIFSAGIKEYQKHIRIKHVIEHCTMLARAIDNTRVLFKTRSKMQAVPKLLQNPCQRLSAVITSAEKFDDARLPDVIAGSPR